MSGFRVRVPFATRWSDNDQYGHLNNTVYYAAMDTAVNAFMIGEGVRQRAGGPGRSPGENPLGPAGSSPIALCAASACEFHASASFPEPLEVGIGVERLGRTSITWSLGILRAGADEPIATGRFVHVFVNAVTRRPVPIPAWIRTAVQDQVVSQP